MRRWLLALFLVSAVTIGAQETSLDDPSSDRFFVESQLPIYQEDEDLSLDSVAPRSPVRLLFDLVIFLVIFSGIAYLVVLCLRLVLKRVKQSTAPEGEGIESFRVLSEQPLGAAGQSLKVVELYSQIVVLSESPRGIHFLYEIKDPDIKNQVLLDFSKNQGQVMKEGKTTFFSQWQNKFKQLKTKTLPEQGKVGLTGDSKHENSDKMEFLKESQDRLRDL